MTEQIDSGQPLVLGYVPEMDTNRPEGREWRRDVEAIVLTTLTNAGTPLLAAVADDLDPYHFNGESRLVCEALIRIHQRGADLTGETLRREVADSVSPGYLNGLLAKIAQLAANDDDWPAAPLRVEHENLMCFLRELRREAPELPPTRGVADILTQIEDFRSMQEGAEAMMLSKLLEDDREINEVLAALDGVVIPVEMRRSHLELLCAIADVRDFGETVTVTSCIDWLHRSGRLETAGGRAKVMMLAGFPENMPYSALDLARRVAKFSRARFNAGQEVWPVALYRWYDVAERLLYVGITESLTTRTSAHGRKSSWSAFAARRTVVRYPDRKSAETMERSAIQRERPLFNHQHNDTPEARQRLVAYLVEHGRMDLLAPAVSRG